MFYLLSFLSVFNILSSSCGKNEENSISFLLAKNWKTTGNLKSAEKLVTSHLRLVAKIAMGYKG